MTLVAADFRRMVAIHRSTALGQHRRSWWIPTPAGRGPAKLIRASCGSIWLGRILCAATTPEPIHRLWPARGLAHISPRHLLDFDGAANSVASRLVLKLRFLVWVRCGVR